MARRSEKGIDYFPMNTDIVHNKKVKLVVAEFGPKAWAVLLPLLCKIYRENGYWLDWYDHDAKLLFAKDECQVDVPFVDEVVAGCIRRGFFDKTVFDLFGVLTSDRIQENFFVAKTRSKNVEFIKEFFVENANIDINKQNVNIIKLNVDILIKIVDTCTQNKKENKNKKERENTPDGVGYSVESPHNLNFPKYDSTKGKDLLYVHKFILDNKPNDWQPYFDMWNIFAKDNGFPVKTKLNKEQKGKLLLRIKEPEFNLAKILAKAKPSDFLKSQNWFNFGWLIKNSENYIKVLEGNYDNKIEVKNDKSTAVITTGKLTASEEAGREILKTVLGSEYDDVRESTAASS